MSAPSGLQPMLEARSVAIVGASTRPGSVGNVAARQLLAGGFTGTAIAVNPRYSSVEGVPCVSTLAEAGPIDLAVLAVGNQLLEDQLASAIDAGVKSVAIFGSCVGTARDGGALIAALQNMAREAAIPVCGGNGMGFVNLDQRLRVCGFHQPTGLEAGSVTFLTHSGSLFSAMLHNQRGLRFNLAVSSGNEMVTTMDQYLGYALELPTTRVIGLFLETVRDPVGMAAVLSDARQRDIPVVALKVGKTARAQRAVSTHSEALAGDHGAFRAFAEFHGVHLVDSMDEMADCLELFTSSRRARDGGLGAVHDSGGERTLLIDLADQIGVRLATVSAETRAGLAEVLDEGLEPENPVDAWGTGHNANQVFAAALNLLAQDPAVGVVAFCVDLTAEERPDDGYGQVPIGLLTATDKPVIVVANLGSAVDLPAAEHLRQAGIPVLHGTETGLRAIRHLFAHRDWAPRNALALDPPHSLWAWRSRLEQTLPLTEEESFALLADFGMPLISYTTTVTLSETMDGADRFGYPVVLKITGTAHKTEAGGVVVDIQNRSELIRAWETLSPRSERLMLQPMAPGGFELAIGLVADPQFGPILLVATGGVLIELLADQVTSLLPVDADEAIDLLKRLRSYPQLAGYRGQPAVSVGSIQVAIAAMARLGAAVGDLLSSVDVNPLIVFPEGAAAVDVLVITKAAGR
jgi:acyl-CoA synthetase (NDP forming)